MYPNEVAADLAQWAPQAMLMDVLDQLTPATLSVDGRIDALLAIQRHLGLLHAQETELLAALDIGDDTSDEFTRDCVAAALRVPPASMRTRMTIARELADRLPATVALLRAGEITQRHALALADATHSLSAESAAAVETRVLSRAPEQTSTQFRASVRRAVLRESTPAAEEKSHQDAVTERRVVMIPADRGMAFVNCFLTADGAATVMSALDAIAYETIHGKGGDPRTADQRRADALVELCAAALADPHLARGHGQRPAIQVTIAASTPDGPRRSTGRTGRVRPDHRGYGSAYRDRPHRNVATAAHRRRRSGPLRRCEDLTAPAGHGPHHPRPGRALRVPGLPPQVPIHRPRPRRRLPRR